MTPPISADGDAFTYLLTPRFRVSDQLMLYARFASGYRPGGPNNFVPGSPRSFKPDTATTMSSASRAT